MPERSFPQQIEKMLRDIERETQMTCQDLGKDKLDPKVLAALAKIPRHEFVPEESRLYAYKDGPIPIGYGQTVSQPFMVAVMTDLLQPQAEDTLLEIGTGSGYQTAVLAELVRKVYSIEIIPELAEQAADRLRRLGYGNVEIKVGDGYFGWPEHAPFDGILVTAAAPRIPDPLLAQLKPGRRLVIPVGNPEGYQILKVVEKNEQGQTETWDVFGVAFVPLTGNGAENR